jgi:septum formation protein
MARLILASASPRRSALLSGLGVEFQVEPADIDETPLASESPAGYVRRMAAEKAAAVLARHPHEAVVVLASDTSVVAGGAILGKPLDRDDAAAMLRGLSDGAHEVLTAVCVCSDRDLREVVVITRVVFGALTSATIDAYLATEEPWDKAGSYGIQGLGGAFVTRIEGSYSNVVGLPLAETRELLVAFGIPTALDVDTEIAMKDTKT